MSDIRLDYRYDVYRNGIFLGTLPDVSSPYRHSQDINTAGSQISVTCKLDPTLDVNTQLPYILTETGEPILTEDGAFALVQEGTTDTIGSGTGVLFQNGNTVKVIEISPYHINGKQLFSGRIDSWKLRVGTGSEVSITLKLYSDGRDLNNVLVPGADAMILDQSQTSFAGGQAAIDNSTAVGMGQSFTVGVGVTNLSMIDLYLSLGGGVTSSNVTLNILTMFGVPSLGTVTKTVTNASAHVESFVFSTPVTVTPGSTYLIEITCSSPIGVGYLDPAAYGGGNSWVNLPSLGGWSFFASTDLYFKTYKTAFVTKTTYTAVDPSDMAETLMDYYVASGGPVIKPSGGYALTTFTTNFTFNVNTILEGIQQVAEVAPFDWYWFVDLGTSELQFKQTSTTADYVLNMGKHFKAPFEFEATVENIMNLLYFTGAEVAGVNIFKTYSDQTSINTYGQRLGRYTNGLVDTTTSADLLGNSLVDEKKDEQYIAPVTISRETMDITLFKPGETVRLSGTGINFIENMILRIARIDYLSTEAKLTLGVLPPRSSTFIKKIENDLQTLQQFANPLSPS